MVAQVDVAELVDDLGSLVAELVDDLGSLVGDLEDAAVRQQRRIAKLEALIELLCGRRWENLTFRQAKNLGERIQNELFND